MTLTATVHSGDFLDPDGYGNNIRDRTIQQFATVAERDAQWPATSAPNGAMCVTMDTYTLWQNRANAWQTFSPRTGTMALAFFNGADLANINPGTGGGITPISSARWARAGNIVQVQMALVIGTSGFGLGTTTGAVSLKLPFGVDAAWSPFQRAGSINLNAGPIGHAMCNLQTGTVTIGGTAYPYSTLIYESTHGGTWTTMAASLFAASSALWGGVSYVTADP